MALEAPFPIEKSTILFGAEPFYRLIHALLTEGVVAPDHFKVQAKGSPDLSVDVLAGEAIVRFASPEGGKRYVVSDATDNSGTPGAPTSNWTATFSTPDATNPRLDRVVLFVRDANLDATSQYDVKLRVVSGTPTNGATLTNLTGAAAVPSNCLLLANVLVRASASDIVNGDIDSSNTVRKITTIGGRVGNSNARAVFLS